MESLRETLCAQQRLLQKLYNELDAEREASSTAASEALSMIIRLQGEKAAVKMEAEQYKRMVEEKMFHAEESLAIFEDIMYQKEMELAVLGYQVQAYRHKLMSMGCVEFELELDLDLEPGNGEIKMPENLLQRRNSAPMLLPPKHPNSRKGIDGKERSRSRSLTPEKDLVCRDGEDSNSDSGKKIDTLSYWDEIRKLDGRVKEIAGVNYATNWECSTRSPSPSPASESSGNSYDPMKGTAAENGMVMDGIRHPDELKDNEKTRTAGAECSSYPRVLDVFEVPQNDKNYDGSKLCTRNQANMISQNEDKLQKPDSVSEEIVKSSAKDDETDWLKSMMKSSCRGKNLIRPTDFSAIDCNMAIINSTMSFSECSNRLHHVNKISEIVEVDRERETAGRESAGRQEELKLLHEITEQLNSIKHELRSLKPRKRSERYELAFATLMEDMLHFWL